MEETPFIGHWHFEKQIGKGGFGFVSLWENIKTGQRIAIKKCQINPNLDQSSSEKLKERWKREIQYMTHEVKNENIVQGLLVKPWVELNKTSPMPILVMEYCEGGDLRTLLNKQKNINGLMESEVRGVLKCLSSAISYLHDIKISHRDIKPENCVIKTNPQGEKIYKLTDLGYAKSIDRNSLIASCVGTPEYVAPELLITDKYSNKCDYWSFGVIGFEIITGVRPFMLHMPPVQWLTAVSKKKSEHICITETNEDITYGSLIYPENQVSSCFKAHMENWLRLALEWNPKHRGLVFAKQISESVPFADMSNTLPPNLDLKIFTMLDDILNRKVLTVFCLHTYQSYSFKIDASTTMKDLLESIEKSTAIPKEKIRLIIPVDNHRLEKIEENTKPINLHIDKYFDKPMLFVGYSGTSMKIDTVIGIPEIVRLVMADFKIKLKPHILIRFINAVCYFIRNEQKKYVTLLDGFYNYSLQLNHQIELYEWDVNKMLKSIYELNGAIKMLDCMLGASKATNDKSFKFNEFMKLRDKYQNLQNDIGALVGSFDKIVNRFRSALRRSWELMNHPLLEKEFHKKDFFNIAELSIKSKVGREHLGRNTNKDNQLLGIFKSAYNDCLIKRDKLLQADQLVKFQKQVVSVSIDIEDIIKAAKNDVLQGKMYEQKLHQISDGIVKQIQSQNCDSINEIDLIQDMERILDSEVIGELNLNTDEPVNSSYKRNGDSLHFVSTLGNSINGASIIDNNESLRKRLADAVDELESEFTTIPYPTLVVTHNSTDI